MARRPTTRFTRKQPAETAELAETATIESDPNAEAAPERGGFVSDESEAEAAPERGGFVSDESEAAPERREERADETVEFGKGAVETGEREVGKIRDDAGSAVEDGKAVLDETREHRADRVDDAVGFGRGAVDEAVETGDGAVGGFGTGSADRGPIQETSPVTDITVEDDSSGSDAVDIGRDPMADLQDPVDDALDPFDRTHPDDAPVFEDKTGTEDGVDESTNDLDIDPG